MEGSVTLAPGGSERLPAGRLTKAARRYRWGLGEMIGRPRAIDRQLLAAIGQRDGRCRQAGGWPEAVRRQLETLYMGGLDVPAAVRLVLWAAALPTIDSAIPKSLADDLRTHLEAMQSAMAESAGGTAAGLIAGGELALLLADQSCDRADAKRLRRSGRQAIDQFAANALKDEAIYLADPSAVRAVLASLIRCQRNLRRNGKSAGDPAIEVAARVGVWVAALTLPRGGSAFAVGKPAEPIDAAGGLLQQMHREFDALASPATLAAESILSGRDRGLVVTAELGPSLRHNEAAGLSVLMPAWHARRGRAVLHVDGGSMHVTLLGGRRPVINGPWDVDVAIDAVPQEPAGDWRCVCEYFDDEVQYLEWEIDLPIGWRLSRQWLSIGDDAAVMIAESVTRQSDAASRPGSVIELDSRLPLGRGHRLHRAAAGKARLSRRKSIGWALSPPCPFTADDETAGVPGDRSLNLRAGGRGAVWHPTWIDLSKKSRKWGVTDRLIRPLTVALDRQIVPPAEASAYRVAIGTNQYLIYQSNTPSPPRTVLGKHLRAGLYVGRFHPGDGGLEDLLVVDGQDDG